MNPISFHRGCFLHFFIPGFGPAGGRDVAEGAYLVNLGPQNVAKEGKFLISGKSRLVKYYSLARYIHIPGTPNNNFLMVVSIGWLAKSLPGKLLFHHFHPFKNGCLGFQVYIYIYIAKWFRDFRDKFWNVEMNKLESLLDRIISLKSSLYSYYI